MSENHALLSKMECVVILVRTHLGLPQEAALKALKY